MNATINNNAAEMKNEKIHVFQAAGLGLAPFIVTSVSDEGVNVGGEIVINRTCDYCGTGIRYVCHVRSADGKSFVVGCDCVRKTDDDAMIRRASAGLADAKLTPAQRAGNALREADRVVLIAENEKRRQVYLAERMAKAAKWAPIAEEFRPLASDLEKHDYNDGRGEIFWANSFIGRVVADLLNGDAELDGDRREAIAIEIFAKQFGRKNSKAYNAAAAEIEAKIDAIKGN